MLSCPNTEATWLTCIRDPLNFCIQRDAGIRQDTEDQLRVGLGSITGLEPGFLQSAVQITLRVGRHNGWSAVDHILF